MHEMMVAQNILAVISAEAEKQNARPVAARISCGKLYAINDELLCFAFEAIAKGTNCEGIKLEIEHKPLRGQCESCGEIFEFEVCHPACTKCGCEDFKLLEDEPLMLETIELQTE